jgi:NTP pyrophosphatase (non-canonical NTP hydrolase)
MDNNVYGDVLDTIKQLCAIDEKTLSQKALKLGEEFGELAKAVLPYENGFATTHRFVTSTKILEEVADTMLCALSIAYDLGFSDGDLRDMMVEKCLKWSKLQQANIKGRFPLPFEIHITVKLPGPNMVEYFKDVCNDIGVKPIVLDLKAGVQDVMTSSVIMSDNKGAYEEMCRISELLKVHNFNVIRDKIETVPWHPAAPLVHEDVNINRYFECHINIVVNDNERAKLIDWNDTFDVGGHFSKNVFKRINDEDYVQMLTLRSSTITKLNVTTAPTFIQYITNVLERLNTDLGLRDGAVLKHTIEYAIYDTNIAHDTSWVTEIKE